MYFLAFLYNHCIRLVFRTILARVLKCSLKSLANANLRKGDQDIITGIVCFQ